MNVLDYSSNFIFIKATAVADHVTFLTAYSDGTSHPY